MRKTSLRAVALLTAILAIFSSTSLCARPVEIRLECEGASASPGKPFVCHLLIVNPKEGNPLVIPKLLLPGRFSFRPQTLVTFDATRNGSATTLQIAKPAQRGRYDVATLSAEELFILQPGRVYGWQYDLNGDDWVLPETPGRYQISANLDVRLAQRNKEGQLDPGVKEFLERYPHSTAGDLMDGHWSTKPIMVRVLTPSRGNSRVRPD
jgi:hypothetical protein